MPTHVHVSTKYRDIYRDPMSNIAGKMLDVLVRRTNTLTCMDTYTIVVPEHLTSLQELAGLLHHAWPAERRGETLIVNVAMDDAE